MDFWQVIQKRKSVRSFDLTKDVSDEQIEKMMATAKRAPSAGGIYPVDFVVVRDKETKDRLAEAALGQYFITEAPVVMVTVSDLEKTVAEYGERGRNLYAVQDAAVATENLLLAATALGLDTCWVGAFDEDKVSNILNLESAKRPLTIVPVGFKK